MMGWSLSTPGTELKKTHDPTKNCQLIGLGEWVQKKYIYFFSLRHVNHYVGLPYHYFNSSNLSRIFDFEYSFGYLLYKKDARSSKIKNIPDLLCDDKEG